MAIWEYTTDPQNRQSPVPEQMPSTVDHKMVKLPLPCGLCVDTGEIAPQQSE